MKVIFGRDTKALYTDEDRDYLVFRDTNDCFYFYKRVPKRSEVGVLYKESGVDDVTLLVSQRNKKKLLVVMTGPSEKDTNE